MRRAVRKLQERGFAVPSGEPIEAKEVDEVAAIVERDHKSRKASLEKAGIWPPTTPIVPAGGVHLPSVDETAAILTKQLTAEQIRLLLGTGGAHLHFRPVRPEERRLDSDSEHSSYFREPLTVDNSTITGMEAGLVLGAARPSFLSGEADPEETPLIERLDDFLEPNSPYEIHNLTSFTLADWDLLALAAAEEGVVVDKLYTHPEWHGVKVDGGTWTVCSGENARSGDLRSQIIGDMWLPGAAQLEGVEPFKEARRRILFTAYPGRSRDKSSIAARLRPIARTIAPRNKKRLRWKPEEEATKQTTKAAQGPTTSSKLTREQKGKIEEAVMSEDHRGHAQQRELYEAFSLCVPVEPQTNVDFPSPEAAMDILLAGLEKEEADLLLQIAGEDLTLQIRPLTVTQNILAAINGGPIEINERLARQLARTDFRLDENTRNIAGFEVGLIDGTPNSPAGGTGRDYHGFQPQDRVGHTGRFLESVERKHLYSELLGMATFKRSLHLLMTNLAGPNPRPINDETWELLPGEGAADSEGNQGYKRTSVRAYPWRLSQKATFSGMCWSGADATHPELETVNAVSSDGDTLKTEVVIPVAAGQVHLLAAKPYHPHDCEDTGRARVRVSRGFRTTPFPEDREFTRWYSETILRP
jgi:hypothetical protein